MTNPLPTSSSKGKNYKCFPNIGNRTGIPAFTALNEHSTESPSHNNLIRRRNKGIHIANEIIKLSLFADGMILYGEP